MNNSPLSFTDPTGLYTDYSKLMGNDVSMETIEEAEYTDEDLAITKLNGQIDAYNDAAEKSNNRQAEKIWRQIESGLEGAFNFDFGADQRRISSEFWAQGNYVASFLAWLGGAAEAGMNALAIAVVFYPDLVADGSPNSIQAMLSRAQGTSLGNLPVAAGNGTGATLRPYGGPGGGHHVPAKSGFTGAPGYNVNSAPAIPNAELSRLGVSHSTVTGAQMTGYRSFAQTGQTLTWDTMARIETNALVRGGMSQSMAQSTVNNAIQALKNAGVANPTRIPWGN